MKIQRLSILLAVAILATTSFAVPPPDQPFMQAALADLREAMTHLRNATADKGGHRQRAIDHTNAAITAVNRGIEYDRNNITPRRRNSFDSGPAILATVDQPNMEKARKALQDAMANLRKASDDKGGFKKQAMSHTTNAINSVNAGIQFDRTH